MALSYVNGLRHVRLDAIGTFVGASGKFRVYSGTKPATGAAIGGATLLAEMTLPAAWGAAGTPTPGAISVGTITSGTAVASGTPTWARFWKADGTTACVDMTAGVGSGDLNFAQTIVIGGIVACSSAVITDGTP